MRTQRQMGDADGLEALAESDTRLLEPAEEREILTALGECKAKLAEALAKLPGGAQADGQAPEDPPSLAQWIAQLYQGDGKTQARLGAIARRYAELRSKLALANMRLVAHVAKRFRDRGITYSDLLQEGFCGLLESIDRFDLGRETKLATYATWWIRQSMQHAVATGAYPVRLSPRHLRQLAQNQESLDHPGQAQAGPTAGAASTELIQRIHAATRPTVSLNATSDGDSNFSLLHTMSQPDGDPATDVDMDETVGKLMGALRPREQQVLELRYGLGGKPRLSLSQVGKVLEVSKERVRQIQDRALEKLRAVGAEANMVQYAFDS